MQPCTAAAASGAAAAQPHRLHYFAGRGRAEQSRWMLAAAGAPFVNVVLRSAAEFAALDASGALLFGQVPLLQADGLNVVQSQAIVRHVAAQAGMLGATAAERALADQLAEGVADFRGPLLSFPFGRDRGACAAAVRRYAPVFERVLGGAGPSGFVAGGATVTYADVLLAEAVTGYTELLGDFTRDAFPLLGAHRDRVCKLPGAQAPGQAVAPAGGLTARALCVQALRRISPPTCASRRRTGRWLTRTAKTCARC